MFDKEKFANTLKKALGERTINQYSLHCGVSATYISKLLRRLVDKPPGVEVISKLASKANNSVTYLELMVAAGHITQDELNDECDVNKELYALYEKMLSQINDLSPDSRRELEKYINLLRLKDQLEKSKDETSAALDLAE